MHPSRCGMLVQAPSARVRPARADTGGMPGGIAGQACRVTSGMIPVHPVQWQSDPVTQNLLPPPRSHRTGAYPRCDHHPACRPTPWSARGTTPILGHKDHPPKNTWVFRSMYPSVCAVERRAERSPLELGVAASKRVEQEPPGKKNEIMPLDSVNTRILLDSHCL